MRTTTTPTSTTWAETRGAAAAGRLALLWLNDGPPQHAPHAPAALPAALPRCSGQVVRGAPKDKKPAGGVADIFDSARAAGAQEGTQEDRYGDEDDED